MSRRPLSLTDDERFLLNHYSNIYNEQLKALDLMYNELKETRDIIDFITKVDERHLRNSLDDAGRRYDIPSSESESEFYSEEEQDAPQTDSLGNLIN